MPIISNAFLVLAKDNGATGLLVLARPDLPFIQSSFIDRFMNADGRAKQKDAGR